jgi:hypothetical protein
MTLLFLLLLVAPQAKIRPAAPTVGDPIVITLTASPDARVSADASQQYEVVGSKGSQLTIRAFQPGNVPVSGVVLEGASSTPFRLTVKVKSVLKPDDRMQPAPLRPPKELPASMLPWKMIGGAVAVAAISWGMLAWAARRRAFARSGAGRLVSASTEFRAAVLAIRRLPPEDANVAALGDATRRFFARLEGHLGRNLTTSELIGQLRAAGVDAKTLDVVREILGEADLAKFSPWGPHLHDSPALAGRALALAEIKRDEGPA